jgi:hypothetical protein
VKKGELAMKVLVCGSKLELNDEICIAYNEKILYNITAEECKLYAESYFEKPFEDILEEYPVESIEKVIEKAMLQEINL